MSLIPPWFLCHSKWRSLAGGADVFVSLNVAAQVHRLIQNFHTIPVSPPLTAINSESRALLAIIKLLTLPHVFYCCFRCYEAKSSKPSTSMPLSDNDSSPSPLQQLLSCCLRKDSGTVQSVSQSGGVCVTTHSLASFFITRKNGVM